MIVENNWLTTNIKERLTNKNLDFDVTITPYPFTKMKFIQACEATAMKIAAMGKPIYIAFSGGADSEYVVRLFKRLNIPFTSLTVKTPGNEYELMYADLVYEEFPDIQKVYIDISKDKIYAKKYLEVFKKTRVAAPNSIALIECAKYAKNNNGIIISGDHMAAGDAGYNKSTGVMLAAFAEWDYYTDMFVTEDILIPFFQYDLSIVYSTVSLYDNSTKEKFRSKLYNTMFRPKFKSHFGRNFNKFLEFLNKKNMNPPKSQIVYGKKQFLGLINV